MEKEIIKLVIEIRDLEKKFAKSRFGPLKTQIEIKQKELDHRLDQYRRRPDPQQALFEAK